MRLEMASYTIRDVQFVGPTRLVNGTLYVDRDELCRLILRDGDFESVALEVVRPGDAVRLIHVMDAIEPRHKPGEASAFPGMLGPVRTAGEGRTHRLAGMAILTVGEAVAGEPTYWREAIVDMTGPGAAASPFGATINLVLELRPAPAYLDADRPDAELKNIMVGSPLAQRYNRAVRAAQLRVAAYVAAATAGLEPDDVRVYDTAIADPRLPRVVYFAQVSGSTLYGERLEGRLPGLMHPNEILDGALLNDRSNSHASHRAVSYFNQNHAVIEELYAHHGRDLNLVGAIVYPAAADDIAQKERLAEWAVKLARLVGAQGACSSYAGGGHPCVEFMLICQKCERAGIRTIQLMPETYGTPADPGFVYFVPEAVGIVSAGRSTQPIPLPAQARVIGGRELFDLPHRPGDAITVPYRYLYGATTSTGYARLAAREY
jgi:glycine reductase complex component B subunit alpha and beta